MRALNTRAETKEKQRGDTAPTPTDHDSLIREKWNSRTMDPSGPMEETLGLPFKAAPHGNHRGFAVGRPTP